MTQKRKKRSCRVYFITHGNGDLTGILMRTWAFFFEGAPPAAYGKTEKEVLDLLEVQLLSRQAENEPVERYLWEEDFETRSVKVDIHPQTTLIRQLQAGTDRRTVIGKKTIPLRLTYAYAKMDGGGFRIVLPRFQWWMIVEALEFVPQVLKNAVSGALLGEEAGWVFDFRHQGPEYVHDWTPSFLVEDEKGSDDDEDDVYERIHEVAEDLIIRARRRKLAPVVGADPAFDKSLPLVYQSPPVSLLLVGEQGAGKSTWVRRLAFTLARLKDEQAPPHIWSTSGGRIIAGMVYLGAWQQRCLDIVEELRYEGDYLYVDHLTSILTRQSDGTSIADIFLPAVEDEAISLIAEATPEEYERARRRYPSAMSLFTVIRITPPAPHDSAAMLQLYQQRTNADLTIHPRAMDRLVRFLEAYQRDVAFPGKGFVFLDWLNQLHRGGRPRTFYPADMAQSFAQRTGLPVELIAQDVPKNAAAIAEDLAQSVIGQPDACQTCGQVLARFKAGMNDPERPVAALLFAGPTGVGKTELAKQLARYLFGDTKRLLRYDMSEYMVPGSAQRLLHVGAGVTTLADQVRAQPLSVVLLDEIEKAHPEVFDLLLGVLGEGRLTDDLGRLVDFRMTLIVMTSNLGAKKGASVGFGDTDRSDYRGAVVKHFRPELVGRLDRVVAFHHLTRDHIIRVVELELAKLTERRGFSRRNLTIRVTDGAKARLAELGYDGEMGARPLKRVIEERVITPLAVLLAADPDLCDQVLRVAVEGEGRATVVL